MQHPPKLSNNPKKQTGKCYLKTLTQLFFTVALVCGATFFIQGEEDDEKSMYILLAIVLALVGLVNLVRWILPKKRRRGRDKDGHPHDRDHQYTHSDNEK